MKCISEVRRINIFSEIYGAYFLAAEKILNCKSISENEIYSIISETAFKDSNLFLPRKLIPDNNGADLGLLKRDSDGKLIPVIKNPPPKIITALRKSWLKAKLSDPKFQLFLDDETLLKLGKRLENEKPLYKRKHFRYVDIFSDGDNFSDPSYRSNFRTVLSALKKKEILHITFMTGKNVQRKSLFLPVKIQYSQKNDKFRLYCCSVYKNEITGSGIINIGRIISVINTHKTIAEEPDIKSIFEQRKVQIPATVKVTPERNGVERFMMEFASYEKQAERNTETNECVVKIWYDKQDETELLIRLLSFGPVVEILGPEDFRKQAFERIKKQYDLLR